MFRVEVGAILMISSISYQKIISFIVTVSVVMIWADIYLKYELTGRFLTKKGKGFFNTTTYIIAFYILYTFFLTFKVGSFKVFNKPIVMIGVVMVVFGCVLNIISRHKFVVYWDAKEKNVTHLKEVKTNLLPNIRHPLYFSLLISLYGGSLVYHNYLSFLLVTFVFIPLIYQVVEEEQRILIKEFGDEYLLYVKSTSLFFFKLPKSKNLKSKERW